MRYWMVLVLTVAIAGVASADTKESTPPGITLTVEQIDNSGGNPDPYLDYYGIMLAGNYVTNDLSILTGSDWLSAVLYVVPTELDQIFQYPISPYDAASGNPASPDPNLILYGSPPLVPPLPGLEYDTFCSNGVMGEAFSTTDPPSGPFIFDNNELGLTWYTDDGDDIGDLLLARVTLKNEAQGTWYCRITASPAEIGPAVEVLSLLEGVIVDGEMHIIPEPATMSLLVLGGLGMLIRRKR